MLHSLLESPDLQKFMLIFARLTGLLTFAPPFFNRRLALQLKGGLAFFLALAMYPSVKQAGMVVPATFPDLAFALGFEMLIGYIIGFGVQILFSAFEMTGELIDRQIGFSMASLVDPQTDITVSIMSSLLQNLALFVFISLDGHLWLLRTFAGSFFSLPLLEVNFNVPGLLHHMGGLFFQSMVFAAEFSLPIVTIMLLVQIALGFMQRTIPQLQIFVVGFIFTIVIGLISMRVLLLHFSASSEVLIERFTQEIWFIISHLRNG